MIKVQNLTKYYGDRLAVDNISFNVGKGEIVGLLGPNGAGKTTTMRIITGFLMPTRGNVWVGECNMAENSLEGRRQIGYLPEAIPLYTDMVVRDYLEFAARLRGLNKAKARSRIDDVVDLCHLEEYVDVIISKLSHGFRQRVGVAQAVIHEPSVLILDEPTLGIDPIQVAQTRQLIKDLGKERTILLSSHILPEVSMICDRVIIINNGKIIAEDRIENLGTALRGTRSIRLEVQGPSNEVTEKLNQVTGVTEVTYLEPIHVIESPLDEDLRGPIMEAIVEGGWVILSMSSEQMSLEDIFLELTAGEEEEMTEAEEEEETTEADADADAVTSDEEPA